MSKKYFLAFDLGATSGRSILASITDGKLEMKELTRFPNQIIEIQGKFYWDIFALFGCLVDGLHAAAKENVAIEAIGIDTWGVDFVYIGEDGSIHGLPRAYRDPFTNGAPENFFKIVSQREVYDLTGIQIMNFNSLYQLFAARQEKSSALNAAKSLLFMPDALSYLLTGKQVCEYTIASTSQFLNPKTKKIESSLLEAAGISPELIQQLVYPGEKVGLLTVSLSQVTGLSQIPVIAVAGHDTGSAVAAVPAENERFAYLSSGTWSLMGIETKDPIITEDSYQMNFTNEGGVDGTTRFLKNITGMWLLEQCRKEWSKAGKAYSYPEIVKMAESAPALQSFVDSDHPSFANPQSMLNAIAGYCKQTGQRVPETDAEIIRCIFESLALKYRSVLDKLVKLAPFSIERLHVIGGGAQNKLLNQWTANSIGISVVAGPSEATAIGNIMMQAKAVGLVKDLKGMRQVIKDSVTPETFTPQDKEAWTAAYVKFSGIIEKI